MIEAGQEVAIRFTDFVTPEMTGRQLADAALAQLPELGVLYATGHTRDAVVHTGVLDPGSNLLDDFNNLLARQSRERGKGQAVLR